jgi:hypothetical protein
MDMLTIRSLALAACAVGFLSTTAIADDLTQAQREMKFSESLSGSVLVGTFSIDGLKIDKLPMPERYELKSVEKTKDGLWTFTARVTYLTQDVTLPITVPVVWAGDTPMVSLSDSTLPGLGNQLSAKVIFDGDRYAGTWQHGKFGGHMWGRIERANAATTEPAAKQVNSPDRSRADK